MPARTAPYPARAMMNQPPQPGQYSPDGQWYWTGQQWAPVARGAPIPVPVPVMMQPQSFSRGFFGVWAL